MSVLGTFSKGRRGAATINFDASGGDLCERSCLFHPENSADTGGKCYGIKSENRHDRRTLRDKLARHSTMGPTKVLRIAYGELWVLCEEGYPPPWLRFASSGAMPGRNQVDEHFGAALVAVLELCNANGIPVHLPVESHAKARFYRDLVGDLCTVRESAQVVTGKTRRDGPLSLVAARNGGSRLDRIEEARRLREWRKSQTGRPAIVCPEIVWSYRNRAGDTPKVSQELIKCGAGGCTACSLQSVDVIYPLTS